MQVSEVMGLIDEKLLINLGEKYNIDKANHKVTVSFILISFVRFKIKKN